MFYRTQILLSLGKEKPFFVLSKCFVFLFFFFTFLLPAMVFGFYFCICVFCKALKVIAFMCDLRADTHSTIAFKGVDKKCKTQEQKPKTISDTKKKKEKRKKKRQDDTAHGCSAILFMFWTFESEM